MCANQIIIGLDNGLSPVCHQAIILTNDGLLLIGPWGVNFSEILTKNTKIFILKKALENVVCKMVAILFWPQYVNFCVILQY